MFSVLDPDFDEPITIEQCFSCKELYSSQDVRRGEDDEWYCPWCYDSTGQDPGAW